VTVTLTAKHWSGERPVEGDFLRTGTGRCYRIDFVRWRQRGAQVRGTLRCTVLEDDAVQAGQPGVFEWVWNRRERVAA
jgi:hypothetical protein